MPWYEPSCTRMFVIVSGDCDLFVRVNVWGAAVLPTLMVPKFRVAGANAQLAPKPVRLRILGEAPSLSAMVTVPYRVPVALGRNEAVIVQLAPGARLVPQVLVWV